MAISQEVAMPWRETAPKQRRRDIAAGVHRHRGHPAVCVPELLVRAALPDLHEPESLKAGDDLSRREDRD